MFGHHSAPIRENRHVIGWITAALLGVSILAAQGIAPAVAQDDATSEEAAAEESGPDPEAVEAGLEVWKEESGCHNCHGTFGEGGQGGHFPAGPNLRRTALPIESLREIVACGIPGTQMPYNVEGAYDTYMCYGTEGGEPLPGATPGASLSVEQLDNLMAYLEERVVGQRRVTKQECIEYFGDEDAPQCAAYR